MESKTSSLHYSSGGNVLSETAEREPRNHLHWIRANRMYAWKEPSRKKKSMTPWEPNLENLKKGRRKEQKSKDREGGRKETLKKQTIIEPEGPWQWPWILLSARWESSENSEQRTDIRRPTFRSITGSLVFWRLCWEQTRGRRVEAGSRQNQLGDYCSVTRDV